MGVRPHGEGPADGGDNGTLGGRLPGFAAATPLGERFLCSRVSVRMRSSINRVKGFFGPYRRRASAPVRGQVGDVLAVRLVAG